MATTTATNPGFAFVVNSLLSSHKNAKVLSKAKKECDAKVDAEGATETPVEVIGEDGKVVTSTAETSAIESTLKKKSKIVKLPKSARQQLESVARTKPTPVEREKERRLTAVATKGVVQLFNVVKEQQKNIKHKLDEVGTSTNKRAKVLEQFNEEGLLKKVNDKGKGGKVPKKDSEAEQKKWKVLSDDFMTGAKFKDWDKDSDSD